MLNKQKPNQLFRGNYPSLWDLWNHGVTSSFLSLYLTCKEQTRLSYVEGWSSRTVPLAMEFGTCCHWVLEQAYGTLRRTWPVKRPPKPSEVTDWVKQYQESWMGQVQAPSERQLQQQELVYGMAEAVLPTYFLRWDGDFTGNYTYPNKTAKPQRWETLEEVFDVPYKYPDGLITHLRGRRDGVFFDKAGRRWVFDTKCRSVIIDDDILDTLPVDLQQMLYLTVTTLQNTKYPSGTIVNTIRRPGHRRGSDESMPSFLERMAKDVANPKKFDHNFIRYEMSIGRDEIDGWQKNFLAPVMDDVRAWWEGRSPHFMNPLNLISKYGRAQLFLPIVKNDFIQCYRRRTPFNELAEV